MPFSSIIHMIFFRLLFRPVSTSFCSIYLLSFIVGNFSGSIPNTKSYTIYMIP